MIDTNVRCVKKEDKYTALSVAQKSIKSLCARCAANTDCKKKASLERLVKGGMIDAKITSCSAYEFPIAFIDQTGTDKEHFNTFRMGKAWSSRLNEGDTIGLVDKNNELYGKAIVTDVFSGSKDDMLLTHGAMNHLMIDRYLAFEPSDLARVLRNCYGNLIYKNNDMVSVIYLRRSA